MAEVPPIAFTDSREDYEAPRAPGVTLVYTSGLHLPQRVRPLCEELRQLAATAQVVNVLEPVSAFFKLRTIRRQWEKRQPAVQSELASCIKRMSEPVEGAPAIDLGWIQGFTFAAGMSAFTELNTSMSAVSETLDRKAAYSMACFSLYIALISFVVSVVLGLLSIK